MLGVRTKQQTKGGGEKGLSLKNDVGNFEKKKKRSILKQHKDKHICWLFGKCHFFFNLSVFYLKKKKMIVLVINIQFSREKQLLTKQKKRLIFYGLFQISPISLPLDIIFVGI